MFTRSNSERQSGAKRKGTIVVFVLKSKKKWGRTHITKVQCCHNSGFVKILKNHEQKNWRIRLRLPQSRGGKQGLKCEKRDIPLTGCMNMF